MGVRGCSKSQEKRRRAGGALGCAPLRLQPRAQGRPRPHRLVGRETRSCYWSARRGRGVGAGRRQPPRARRATTSSPRSGCGLGPTERETEPGEGEQSSSIASSASTPRKRPSGGDPGRPPDPGALAQPFALRCSARLREFGPTRQARGGSMPGAGSERGRDGRGGPGSPGALLAGQHDGPEGPRSPCVTLAAPRPREVVAQLRLHLGRPGRPRPRACHSALPGLLEDRGSRTLRCPRPDWPIRPSARLLPGDEVAGETGAPVLMTTGALGLAWASCWPEAQVDGLAAVFSAPAGWTPNCRPGWTRRRAPHTSNFRRGTCRLRGVRGGVKNASESASPTVVKNPSPLALSCLQPRFQILTGRIWL